MENSCVQNYEDNGFCLSGKRSSTNYVDKILPIIDHLFTPAYVDICHGIPLLS